MKIKRWFLYKELFWKLPWDYCYKEKKGNLKSKKIPKNSCETLLSSVFFYPLEVVVLELANSVWFTPITVFPVCLFDAEQHVIVLIVQFVNID